MTDAVSEQGRIFLDRARSLEAEILGARVEMDRDRCIPAPLVQRLRDAELFHLWLPRTIGGPQLHPVDLIAVIEELSRADGSVGWCAANASVNSMISGSLPEASTRHMYGDRAVSCGSFLPGGKAVVVPGGYRLSGRWNYATGIVHSGWMTANSVIMENGAPRLTEAKTPELRFLFIPVDQGTIIDTWEVSGMRATGSHDFEVHDLFVPDDLSTPTFVNTPLHPGTLYQLPRMSLFTVGIGSVPLGIARAAVDALIAIAQDKVPMGAMAPLREKVTAQVAAGQAEALLRAARAGLVEAVNRMWEEVDAGKPPSLDSRGAVRLAATFATEASARVVDLVQNAAGGSALFESGRIARCFRDVHAATSHIGLHTNNYEAWGRFLVGMDPGTPRF